MATAMTMPFITTPDFLELSAARRGSIFENESTAAILLEMKYSRHSDSSDEASSSTSSSEDEHDHELDGAEPADPKSFRRTLYGNEWGTKNSATTLGHCLAERCMLCERGCPSLLVKSPTWASIMRVVFFCLQNDYPAKQFFSLKNDVYQFMVEHWNKLCLNKKRSDNWHKQIQDMLSHSKNVFESGVDIFKQNGYWRLRQLSDPWSLDREGAVISKKTAPADIPPKRTFLDEVAEPIAAHGSPKKFKSTPPASPATATPILGALDHLTLSSPASGTPALLSPALTRSLPEPLFAATSPEVEDPNDVFSLRRRLSAMTTSLATIKSGLNFPALTAYEGAKDIPSMRPNVFHFSEPSSSGSAQM
eukprot:TRINITY_DN54_c0_g1_i2.p1 TRINITY_DN54_c0_g1~~TRINITY_DN54_c0_g1_i2.p1  ORF type:complete len:399 (-),score=130.92 TRINITY_DN54_c0_g1_i2:204-1292(-)